MKPDANRNKVVLALKKAIVATFDDGKWRELGYLTDRIDLISGHGRLLRSLYWGDNDYAGCVLQVLPMVLGQSFENLEVVEDFVGLDSWLRNNDPALYAELYGSGDIVPLADIEQAGSQFDVLELNRHAARIRKGIPDDPAQAIGSAKELLETVLKLIVAEHGQHSKSELPVLLKSALKGLELDRTASDLPGKDTIRRTISNLGQVVVGVSEVRNLYGTGHGRSKSRELTIAHARLVVNAAVTVATFLLELRQDQVKPEPPPF